MTSQPTSERAKYFAARQSPKIDGARELRSRASSSFNGPSCRARHYPLTPTLSPGSGGEGARRLLAFVVTATFVAATSHAQSTTQPAVDVSSIAGDYALVRANQNAEDIPAKWVAATRMKIGDGKLLMDFGEWRANTVITAVNPAGAMATMDLATDDEPSVKLACVYRLEDDQLSLAYRRDGVRPTSFDAGPGVSLFVFKREAATTRPMTTP